MLQGGEPPRAFSDEKAHPSLGGEWRRSLFQGVLLFKWVLSLVVRVAGMGVNGAKGHVAERGGRRRK